MFRSFLFFILFISTLVSEVIVLSDDKNTVDNFKLEYFYDDSKSLQIDDIKNMKFKNNISSQFAFGYIKGNSWFKLQITNKRKNNNFILYMTEPFFEVLNLYEEKDHKWHKRSAGLFTPLYSRDLIDISPAFYLDLKPNTTKIFYIQASAQFAQFGEFKIYTDQSSVTKDRLFNTSLYMLYFGSLVIVTVFSAFLYLILRDKIYLYYANYIFFNTIFVFAFSGIGIYFGLAKWHYEFHLSIPILIIFLILFSSNFLDTKKYLPNTDKILKLVIVFFLVLTILTLIKFNPWYQFITALASISYILLLYTSISIWIKGNSEAKYYLFAMSIYTTSIIIMSLMINGLLENNDITRYSFLFGSFLEIVLFSLMLVNRFHKIKNEKIKIQNELLLIKDKNEQILEEKIAQRTNEIVVINNQLSILLKEKELLLKEVYHRVKNNFQIVISMLSMEGNKNLNEEYNISLFVLISRIKSMSLVHQFLYESETLCAIKSRDYLLKIIDQIKKIYDKQNIKIEDKIEDYSITMDEAMALGIILNEVLNNSAKHYNENKNCYIFIEFRSKNNLLELIIKDNGSGFFYDETQKNSGLGLKLIKYFSTKLKESKFEFLVDNGTTFKLIFKVF